VFVFEIQKSEDKRILDGFFGGHHILARTVLIAAPPQRSKGSKVRRYQRGALLRIVDSASE
jgi:hypothetical protein